MSVAVYRFGRGRQHPRQIAGNANIIGICGVGSFEVCQGFAMPTSTAEQCPQQAVDRGAVGDKSFNLARVWQSLFLLVNSGQARSLQIQRLNVIWLFFQSVVELLDGLGVLVALLKKDPGAIVGVVVCKLLADLGELLRLNIDKFRDVRCAVRRGKMFQKHRSCVITLGVDVRQPKLCKWAADLGGKDQPLAVGRPTAPGAHLAGKVASHLLCCAPGRRNDVKCAIRPEQHERITLAEHDPFTIGGKFWEVIALSVVGGPRQ